ncbi:MAG: trypsin-like peptidase domain-containing protein [Pseudooceanicola sp.]|nr:trypsin-like peptidase domain-containing protein [Pseudooceanicola sp.]
MSAQADRDLAAFVAVSPLAFAQAFIAAQADTAQPVSFDAVVPANLSAPDALAEGFAVARKQDWLDDLCARLIADRMVTRDFLAVAAKQTAAEGLIAAQARIEALSPFRDTLLDAQGLLHVAGFVCRIEVDGKHRGTGFLVRPDVVMTAGHVLTPLDGGDPLIVAGQPMPDAHTRVEVLFDDKIEMISGRRRRTRPRRFAPIAPPDPWLLGHSAPVVGAGGVAAAGVADYALFRLDAAPLPVPEGLALGPQDPFATDPLLIVQHPKARAMCHAFGNVDLPDAATRVFTHTVNTEEGSSGAPCFAIDFRVVGLHNGAVLNADPPRNSALSISVPAAILANLPLAPAPLRYLRDLRLASGQDRLVVGRTETQDWLRAALHPTGPRILAVTPTARKTGMSFTADILSALLPRDAHILIRLSAEQFRNDAPPAFAARLFDAAGLPAGQFQPPDPNTTPDSWLRLQFTPRLLETLDRFRAGRMVWLSLDDLRLPLADGNGLRDLLDLLYDSVATHDWLRILLLGYGTTPSLTAAPHLSRIDLPPISPEAIRAAFDLRLAGLDAAEAAPVRANLNALWQFLPGLDADKRLDFAAAAVAPFVAQLP